MSEAQKYQGRLYKDKEKPKGPQHQQQQQRQAHQTPSNAMNETAVVPRQAYVEDEDEGGMTSGTVAVVDAPPKAPSPPPAMTEEMPDVNVFDFLVTEDTPDPSRLALTQQAHEAQHLRHPHDHHYASQGYTYGDAPLEPSFYRYDSVPNLHYAQQSGAGAGYLTPAPRRERSERTTHKQQRSEPSDKKRKRHQLEGLGIDMSRVHRQQQQDHDMTDAPALHSGLTGGLSRLLTKAQDLGVGSKGKASSPLTPLKRNRREDRDRQLVLEGKGSQRTKGEPSSRQENGTSGDKTRRGGEQETRGRDSHRETNGHDESRRKTRHRDEQDQSSRRNRRERDESQSSASEDEKPRQKRITFRDPSIEQDTPNNQRQLIPYPSNPAELFMSFVSKGPESERGMSVNKMLKRYHRERDDRRDERREREEKRESARADDKELWKSLRCKINDRGEVVLFV